jgi:hypothetical protein
MTPISAKVLTVARRADDTEYSFRLELEKDLDSFHTFKFGGKKPFKGFTHNVQLDPVYHKDPHLTKSRATVSALDDSVTQHRKPNR